MSSALAADLREGGSWSFRQRWKNGAIRHSVRLLFWLADRTPARWLSAMLGATGRAAHWLLPRARQDALTRAERVFSLERAREVVRNSFENAGRNLALCLLLRRSKTRATDWVSVDDETRALLEHAATSGAIAISAHIGPFELIPALVTELGLPASIVVRESYDPALDPMVDAHRVSRGIEVIHRGHPHAGTRTLRALKKRRLLGILPDLGGRVASVDVPFLGGMRALPSGPARLALRASVATLLVVLERTEGARPFRLHVENISICRDFKQMTQRVAAHLEAAICRSPEDWLWMAAPSEIADSSARSVS
jgi:KDO2-lipid IV(A) lauroyltransferase